MKFKHIFFENKDDEKYNDLYMKLTSGEILPDMDKRWIDNYEMKDYRNEKRKNYAFELKKFIGENDELKKLFIRRWEINKLLHGD